MAIWDVLSSAIIFTENQDIRFREDGAGSDDIGAILAGTYYLYGDGTDTGDFCKAVKDAMEAASSGAKTYTVNYIPDSEPGDMTGRVTITPSSGTVELRALTEFDMRLLGHPDNVDTGFFSILASSISPLSTWVADQPSVRIDPGPMEVEQAQHIAGDSTAYTFRSSDVRERRTLEWRHVEEARTFLEHNTTDPTATAENFWRRLLEQEPRLRVYRPTLNPLGTGDLFTPTSSDLVGEFWLDEAALSTFSPRLFTPGNRIFGWSWGLRRVPS